MLRSLPNTRLFNRITWATLLLMSLSLTGVNCTQPTDNANDNDNQNVNGNGNGNVNDNGTTDNVNDNGVTGGPAPGEIFVQFDFTTANSDVARALAGDGTQYGFFGEKDPSATSFELTQMDVILPTSVAVRSTLDQFERPLQFLASDQSALLLSYDQTGTEVTAIYVATDGETTETTTILNSSSSRSAAQEFFGVNDMCNVLADFSSITGRVLSRCEDEPAAKLCTGSIAQTIAALDSFCLSELILVIDTLPSTIGRGPALTVPLGVVMTTAADSVTPQTGVSLRGEVFGGSPPYRFDWEVLEDSPSQPEITASQAGTIGTATAFLVAEGIYFIRLTVFDSAGGTTFFDVLIVVSEDPDALVIEAEAEISESDPFVATLTARARGGVGPFAFLWSQFGGPEGGEVSFVDETAANTSATFSTCGTYILEVLASDAMGVSTRFSFPVTIVDLTAGLIAQITFDACGQPTLQDTCVALNGSLTLGVDVVNQNSGDDQFDYEWEVIDGTNSASLSGTTTASPTLTATGPDTLVVQVTVTDQATCQSTTDQISIEVIQGGELAVDIFSDGNATLNQPELLLAQVSGAIGELSYQWNVVEDEGSGTFDDATAQNVQFTPTSRPTVTVQVMVTDSTTGETASATEELSISTFSVSIVGDGSIPRNEVASYTAALSGDAPGSVVHLWTVENRDPDDSLDGFLVDDTAAVLQILPQGDGILDLTVRVTDASDPDNTATSAFSVIVECADADAPAADADDSRVEALSTPGDINVVTLSCSDPNVPESQQETTRNFRWKQVGGDPVDNLHDEQTRFAKFDMPTGAPLGFEPIVFECIVENPTTMCESSVKVPCANDDDCTAAGGTTCGLNDEGLCDALLLSATTTIYAAPLVAPAEDSTDLTVLAGSRVELVCEQRSGSTVDQYDWRQVDADGAEVDPQDRVADFNADSATGVLTFTASSTAQELFFECGGIINGPDGDLAGPFSTDDQAVISVVDFTITAVVREGDGAGGGTLSAINVDRIRLTNTSPGDVVFSGTLDGGAADSGVFLSDLSGSSSALILEGDSAPNDGTFGQMDLFDIDDSANLVFVGPLAGSPAGGETEGVFAITGGVVSEVSANGSADMNPSGNRFCGFDDVALAGSGAVSFLARFDDDADAGGGEDTDCSGTVLEGVYSRSGSVIDAIAESGATTIPGSVPGVKFGNFFEQLLSNDSGEVVFAGRDAGATAFGAFIAPVGDNLDRVFLNNRQAADTNGAYGSDLPADLAINNSAVVAFQADLINVPGSTQGIFISDEPGSPGTKIVLSGSNSPPGLPLSSFEKVAINAKGDIAFIADGRLLFYADSTGAVVEVRNQDVTAVRNGNEIVSGVTINAVNGLADVQLNDAGNLVFSANVNNTGTAIFVARPPN